ncbi:GmrSD restriction endonuclease domain-containing protein [Streptomyces hirsutus]|uniref:GmrSD restriction endonuclease domain-containing protein n=1 Tax=Streptomyces hirsutus TaxID=35620 RepID=UPI00331CDEE6
MATVLFKDTTHQVADLITDIRRGEIALPDLQRPYVWQPAKARELFDSMYKGFPVGYLLFWETGIEPGARQIGEGAKPEAARRLIVDGQQRLTSLFAVMTGTPVVREDYRTTRVRLAFRPSDDTFAVTDAAIERDPEYLPDISVLWDTATGRRKVIRDFLARLNDKRPLTEAEEDRIQDALDRLHDLESYPFKGVVLSADIDEEQVAEIFVRINSEGVKLDQADFILTLTSVFWEDGRRALEEFCRQSRTPALHGASPFNWYIKPKPPQLLRVVAAVGLDSAVLKQVYATLRGRDASGKLSPEQREARFEQLQQAQKHVLDLQHWHEFFLCLERAGFRGEKMISSQNALLYSYALWLIGRVRYDVPLDRLRSVIARWFFMAQLTGRYTGSVESQMEHDLALLREIPHGDADGYTTTLDRVVRETLTSDFWTITLPNTLNSSAAKSPALLAYITALNILDADVLLSDVKVRTRLDPAVLARKGVERHHLFPRKYLQNSLGITTSARINQIANMALLEWSDNIAISDQAPAQYWPAQLAAKGLPADVLARQRYLHALPDDWPSMDYDAFLTARRVLMAQVVRGAFGQLESDSYRPVYSAPTVVPEQRTASRLPSRRIKLSELLDAGLISAGTVLTPAWEEYGQVAVVDYQGRIRLDEQIHDTPSGAANAVGAGTNGWTFWLADTPEGQVSLADLRAALSEEI